MSERSSDILRSQLDDIAKLAGIDVENLMTLLEGFPPKEWAEVIRLMVPQIVATYGPMSTDVTTGYYNERRGILVKRDLAEGQRQPKKFKATEALADNVVIQKQLKDSLEYYIGQTFKNTPQESLEGIPATLDDNGGRTMTELPADVLDLRRNLAGNLMNIVKREIFNHSRRAVIASATRDPARFIAVRSVNSDGCNFCKLQYHAGGKLRRQSFHEGCRCTVDLAPPGEQPKPEWFDEFDTKLSIAAKKAYREDINLISAMRLIDEN